MASLAHRIAQLQRGVKRGSFSATHQARARAELGSLQARARTRRLDKTLYNPDAVLSGSSLRRSANALTDLEAAPLEREQARVGAQAKANVDQIGGLFRDLAASQAAASQRAAGISGAANTAATNAGTAQQAALEGVAQSADQMLGDQSNPYTQGARAQLTALVEQQKSTAASTSAAQSVATAQLGANSEQLLNTLGASEQMRGPELARATLAQANADKSELAAKIADIRGPGKVKLIRDLITGERTFEGTAKAFDLQVDKQDEVKANNRRNYQIAHGKLVEDRKHNRITEEQLGQRLQIEQQNADTTKSKAYWTNKVNAWKVKHPRLALAHGGSSGGAGTATPQQRRTNFNTFSDVVEYVRKNPGAQKGDFGAPSANNLLFQIANDPGYKKTGKIPRKYYAALHDRFPGILTRGR